MRIDLGADAQAAVERATALADEWERRAAEERSSDPAAVEQLRGAARSLRRALAGPDQPSERVGRHNGRHDCTCADCYSAAKGGGK